MTETTERSAQVGDQVRVAYVGCFEDGTQFDSSLGNDPLVFTIGGGDVIPGFDQAVVGMKPGDRCSVVVAPDQGYGPHVPEMVAEVERKMIPDDDRLVVGNFLEVSTEDGNTFEVEIVELSDTTVVLDGNHPLAGKNLHFDIELLDFV